MNVNLSKCVALPRCSTSRAELTTRKYPRPVNHFKQMPSSSREQIPTMPRWFCREPPTNSSFSTHSVHFCTHSLFPLVHCLSSLSTSPTPLLSYSIVFPEHRPNNYFPRRPHISVILESHVIQISPSSSPSPPLHLLTLSPLAPTPSLNSLSHSLSYPLPLLLAPSPTRSLSTSAQLCPFPLIPQSHDWPLHSRRSPTQISEHVTLNERSAVGKKNNVSFHLHLKICVCGRLNWWRAFHNR